MNPTVHNRPQYEKATVKAIDACNCKICPVLFEKIAVMLVSIPEYSELALISTMGIVQIDGKGSEYCKYSGYFLIW